MVVQLLLVTAVFGAATDPRCPQEHKPDSPVMFAHTDNCRKFFMCLADRTVMERECPEGQQFDAESAVRIKLFEFVVQI